MVLRYNFQRNGNLELYDHQRNTIWKRNTTNKGIVSNKMRDENKFLLLNMSYNIVWDSFKNPTKYDLIMRGIRKVGHIIRSKPINLEKDVPHKIQIKYI